MKDNELIEAIATGLLSSGLLAAIVRWALKLKRTPGYKRVIKIERDDGSTLRYETEADNIENRPEVKNILAWLQEIEEEAGSDSIKSVSFTLDPLDPNG